MNDIFLKPIDDDDFNIFQALLSEYYREGEDADTAQTELDDFISYLFGMCTDGVIHGCIAMAAKPAGFILWDIDTPDSPFSNWPGHGTILEIGVTPEYRMRGLGSRLVSHAESEMQRSGTVSFYVCAYGSAADFWKKCGYSKTDRIADNDLPIYAKDI